METPEHFSGSVRLFALPNVVMFPHVMQPLQIFEPRYLEMLADALADDRLFAMALLEPGWELDYEGRPPIAPTVCVGRILSHQPLDDGQQNVLLVGLKRARIVSEVDSHRPYREAVAELLEDEYAAGPGAKRASLQRKLLDLFQAVMPRVEGNNQPLETVFWGDVPLGMLTDIVTYMMPFELSFKQSLLSDTNVEHRARQLLKQLDQIGPVGTRDAASGAFPPQFSAN